MNIIKYPARENWASIVERPHLDVTELNQTVANVLADVRTRGDEAVKAMSSSSTILIWTTLPSARKR